MAQAVTTLLEDDIIDWLKQVSKQRKKTKRSIIEFALQKYREECQREKLQKSFQKAAQDSDIMNMSEEGMDDYSKQIESFPYAL